MKTEKEITEEILYLMESADFIDFSEYIHDDIKFIKIKLGRGESVHDNLVDFLGTLKDENSYIDINGNLGKIKFLLEDYLNH